MRISDWSSDVCSSDLARWIDCTVDSISTTTPRLSPRDSCEPIPITSIGLPGEYSPTSATTLEVPMSSPTMSALSPLRFMSGGRDWGLGIGDSEKPGKIGRAHVCTPVTTAHLVCRLLLEKQ